MIWFELLTTLAKILFLVLFILAIVPVLVLAERKISAWIQDRHGPNRVGPGGLLQPIADGLKFILKEDVIPPHTDKKLYIAAPAIILVPAFITGAVIPFSKVIPPDSWLGSLLSAWAPNGISFQIANINIGILYFLGITSLGIYGVILAGWASNNKYALLGGLRASAQMVSYELSMGLAVLSVVLVAGTLRINEIVESQTNAGLTWWVFFNPIGWLIFTVAAFAETNRLPFDLAECEQELVAGYHTEYSSMKFAMFFLAEYGNMTMNSCLNVCLFFGGYTLFGLEKLVPWWITLLIFLGKVLFFLFVFIWVRWTFPRFRYDQLMHLGWKLLLPLALATVMGNAIAVAVHEIWSVPLWPVMMAGQAAIVGGACLAAYIFSRRVTVKVA